MARNLACLAQIYRYPVKGLAGQPLDSAELAPGRGLPHDRVLAITSGTAPPPADGRWRARGTFRHLAKHPDLARISVDVEGDTLHLHDPDRGRVSVSLLDPGSLAAASISLADWFPSGVAPVRLVQADHGYWDCEDATISVVNLATVAELTGLAGTEIDPARFRANLYLTGLPPWAEFGLAGRRLRVGNMELEILRPIGRCRATSVRPGTGATDLNVPALLGATYGHICCGVYARVRRAGRLAVGDQLLDVSPPGVRARPALAPGAPRPATVVRLVPECDAVRSIWLDVPSFQPDSGGHIRIHANDEAGPMWRSYTVSAAEHGMVRISVRRQPRGRMSRLLHELTEGAQLLVSGPYPGTDLPETADAPVLLASGGIGITPMVAVLRSLVAAKHRGPVLLCHCARHSGELALWGEAAALAAKLADGRARLHLSRPRPGDCERLGASAGRPPVAGLAAQWLPLADTVAYLCGPTEFLEQHTNELTRAGVPEHRLRYEVFTSPGTTAGAQTPPPAAGPFTVRFAASDVTAEWTAEAGSLLDLAEACGLAPPSGCRAGACHTCRQRVPAGTVAHLTEPTMPVANRTALLCCAVPVSNLVIDV